MIFLLRRIGTGPSRCVGGFKSRPAKTVLRTWLRKLRVAPNQMIVQISTKCRGSFNPNSDSRNLPFLLRQGYDGQVGPKPVLQIDSKHLFGVKLRHLAKNENYSSLDGRIGRACHDRLFQILGVALYFQSTTPIRLQV
jgi:hypothetical protein